MFINGSLVLLHKYKAHGGLCRLPLSQHCDWVSWCFCSAVTICSDSLPSPTSLPTSHMHVGSFSPCLYSPLFLFSDNIHFQQLSNICSSATQCSVLHPNVSKKNTRTGAHMAPPAPHTHTHTHTPSLHLCPCSYHACLSPCGLFSLSTAATPNWL